MVKFFDKVLQRGVERTGFHSFQVNGGVRARQLIAEGRREDVRAVWDALPVGCILIKASPEEGKFFANKETEEDWDWLVRGVSGQWGPS